MADSLIGMPLMLVEIIAAECIFASPLKKRSLFWFRLVCSVLSCIFLIWIVLVCYAGITGDFYLYEGSDDDGIWVTLFKFLLYLFIFALTILDIGFCFDGPAWRIVYCCAGAYVTQHMAKNVSSFLVLFIRHKPFWLEYVIGAAVCAVVYVCVYFICVRGKILIENQSAIKKKIIFTLISILVCIGMSRICIDDATRSFTAAVAETLYAVIACLFIMIIYSGYTREDLAHQEIGMIKELNRRTEDHYRRYQDNVDLINIKYHDLKHQLSAVRCNRESSGLEKLAQSIETYGCVVDTGNRALDVVITEKNLFCRENNINLSCSVRGDDFDFFDDVDIYALFGNALSNAIESVDKISDPDKRSICVNSARNGKILSLHFENYADEEIVFGEKNTPVTKKDKNYHGYGMKSMEYIAKQYAGYMTVSVRRNVFYLDFVFPDCTRKKSD